MTCSVCKNDRNTVTPKKSALMSSVQLILCNECLEARREPRYIIIMAGRSGKTKEIRPFLKNKRYVGKEITAADIFV